MKKMLVMILMSAFSLPALAAEANPVWVKAVCTLTEAKSGDVSHESIEFRNGNSSYDEGNAKCVNDKPDSCATIEVEDTSVVWTFYKNGESFSKRTLDRIDGTYKVWMRGNLYKSGTCEIFKQKI